MTGGDTMVALPPAPAQMAACLCAQRVREEEGGERVFWERSRESHHSQPWSTEARGVRTGTEVTGDMSC